MAEKGNDREQTEHWEFQMSFPKVPLKADGIYTGRCDEISRCAKGAFWSLCKRPKRLATSVSVRFGWACYLAHN